LRVSSPNIGRMERRQRRSRDRHTALHLFLESQLSKQGSRSIRVTRRDGEVIAGVGDDAYVDEWTATWTVPVGGVDELVVASSGGRPSDDVARGVRRILAGR